MELVNAVIDGMFMFENEAGQKNGEKASSSFLTELANTVIDGMFMFENEAGQKNGEKVRVVKIDFF